MSSTARDARKVGAPPADIAPAELLANLLSVAPSLPLRTRLDGADEVELRARAIPALEMTRCLRSTIAPESARAVDRAIRLVTRAVFVDNEPAFGSARETGLLEVDVLLSLANETMRALQTICPTYVGSDWQAWHDVLLRGARAPEVASTAIALAGCAELGPHGVVFRPDRFWGLPVGQLLDGHWMAYRAARAAWVQQETTGPRTVRDALEHAKSRRATTG